MLFATKADKFYRQLKRLDVKEFLAREKMPQSGNSWRRDVLVEKKSLKQDKICIQLFSMMKSVPSVSVEFRGHYLPLTMLPIIDMTSLSHIKISKRDVPSGAFTSKYEFIVFCMNVNNSRKIFRFVCTWTSSPSSTRAASRWPKLDARPRTGQLNLSRYKYQFLWKTPVSWVNFVYNFHLVISAAS